MSIKRGYLYIVDFNPRIKTKRGKLRPVLVLQSDLVNEAGYPSSSRRSLSLSRAADLDFLLEIATQW